MPHNHTEDFLDKVLEEKFIDYNWEFTIPEYIIELGKRVWIEGESFSGKRAFGDSGWQWILKEQLEEKGYLEKDCDWKDCDKLIQDCCSRMLKNFKE